MVMRFQAGTRGNEWQHGHKMVAEFVHKGESTRDAIEWRPGVHSIFAHSAFTVNSSSIPRSL